MSRHQLINFPGANVPSQSGTYPGTGNAPGHPHPQNEDVHKNRD